MDAMPQASPAPGLGLFYQVGTQGISFDRATKGKEVVVLLHWKRLEPALVERARTGGVVVSVPALRVRHGQPAQPFGQVAIVIGPNHQVPVVRHAAIRQQAWATQPWLL